MSEIRSDPAHIGAFWDAMVASGDVHEVRIPKTRKGPARLWGAASGYFADREAFVNSVAPLTGEDAEGIYLTLNPVDPELLARACNRLVGGKPVTTADNDITVLRHLLIDIDPVRKSGISSTDEEQQHALRLRDQIQTFLRDEWQWPKPLAVTMSGNGSALLYRIALENTTDHVDLVRKVLLALHALFTDPAVTIDTSNSNPSRLTKVLGTVAAKGDALPHRPWRLATGVLHDHAVEAVSFSALSAVAALASASSASGTNPTGGFGDDMPNVAGWLTDAGIGYHEADKGYATIYRLDRCLTSDDHTDGACILAFPSGALAYRCHHDRCAGKSWVNVREGLVPPAPTIRSQARSPEGTFTAPRDHTEAPRSGGPAAETTASDWPVLDPAALTGLAGEVVRIVGPHTEGDPVAVLANFLTMFGSAVGPSPHALVGATRHRANLFVVHVGETARARKGTAHAEAFRLVSLAAMHWDGRVMGGLSSGEGLIFAVRDATTKINKDGQEVPDDPGAEDRRLLAVEPEFSSVLRVARRDGSTLTEILRRAWDGDTLRTLTRNSPLKATGAHIAILGHITVSELKRELTETSQLNGYANRHLFLCVRRSRLLPHGGSLSDRAVSDLARQIRMTLEQCRRITSVRRDAEANAMWEAVYPALTAERPGMFGATTARAEAQVLRLSLIYALLDGSATIRAVHLEAGLAVWQYAEDSAGLIFADATGDPIADRLLTALRSNGPMTQSEIVDLFGRHTGAAKLGQAQEMLVSAGKIRSRKEETGGRPRVIWEAV